MVVKDAVRPQDLRNPTSFPCARPLWVNECFTDRTKQQPQCFSSPQKTLKNGTLFDPEAGISTTHPASFRRTRALLIPDP